MGRVRKVGGNSFGILTSNRAKAIGSRVGAAEQRSRIERKSRESLLAEVEALTREPTLGTIGMVRRSSIGDEPAPSEERAQILRAAFRVGATLDPPGHHTPEDSIHEPLSEEELRLIGSSLKEAEVWRGTYPQRVKYPVNEAMAMARRPFQKPRQFWNPAPLINGRANVPAPPRCYSLSTAREMIGVNTPTMIENNHVYNFKSPIPVPNTPRAMGGVVYRDATGDIYRHHSPC